ncbi:NADH dehydrogenase [ubiquinone] 1 beta subcomplex subunit 7 [Onthophagus taurus]|uniref:NADH dehydrogenase [ubiquinone] 1 beta subcomplex subunit 7 n=1 Tax=Onthophagus taurus TaxID=166361 RepID=UPI000C20152D|nr:NADH dehydrogenase [ubiquinone] 1 beta subcomplex subunit 7 [Onthophagus taurus]
MGNAMGYTIDNAYNLKYHPDVTPHPLKESRFDPQEGFQGTRKRRSVNATKEDMLSAKIPPQNRDYCVDYLLKFQTCRKDNFPWVVACEHEKHEYLHCQHEDFVLRMKEFERERRLMVREKQRSG